MELSTDPKKRLRQLRKLQGSLPWFCLHWGGEFWSNRIIVGSPRLKMTFAFAVPRSFRQYLPFIKPFPIHSS